MQESGGTKTNTNSTDCEVNFAYPKMIDSKKVLTYLGVLDYN